MSMLIKNMFYSNNLHNQVRGKMDKIDFGIIDLLSRNSRTSFVEIGKKLDVSESTIRKRVVGLEKEGVIKKYSLVVNTGKMGFENVALIGVDASADKYLEVAKKLKDVDGVRYAASTAGDHMFMLEVWAKDNDELSSISDKLKRIEGVTRICPAIIKDTLKESL